MFASSRGLSQLATSFIASWSQGIRPVPFSFDFFSIFSVESSTLCSGSTSILQRICPTKDLGRLWPDFQKNCFFLRKYGEKVTWWRIAGSNR